MRESIQGMAAQLKEARIKKGLTQRELSKRTKIPQNHISQIERGLVDLQLSSFIEIARTLEMEPVLIPRMYITAIQALLNPSQAQTPAYQLDSEEEEI